MSGAMYLAAAGALVQQLRLEMLANDVANVNTLGYKGERSVFRMPQEDREPILASVDQVQTLSPYAPPFETAIDFSQGALQQTGNPLDVAIDGDGFFSIETPDGQQYTRQGGFTVNSEGVLTTHDGYPVLGEGGEITITQGTVEIDSQGVIYVDGDEVGQLQIIDFEKRNQLMKVGNGRFVTTDPEAVQTRPENYTISQGFVETANVNPIRAMTEMIETSRIFDAYQKVIQSADEATGKSIKDVGTIA